ncbi:helix-turn-helix domain-containing protein [Heyndrickxia sporothermodurans]
MNEGKIIKFYREKAKITQKQLCNEICSDTHISKIENGLMDYSPEIIPLLCKRLGIDIEREVTQYKSLEKQLKHLQNTIIIQQVNEANITIHDLQEHPLIYMPDFYPRFQLLVARTHMLLGEEKKAYQLLKKWKKQDLNKYENNLFKHVLGIYYLSKKDYENAINILQTVNQLEYNNPEYYFDLATSYHAIHSQVNAYYYAEKALQFFKRKNIFLRVIDAEMLMLMQEGFDDNRHFNEIIEKYKQLIQSCDLCHARQKKAKVLHNLAYEYFKRQKYRTAAQLYEETMKLKKKNSESYLVSLEGYLQSCIKGNLLSYHELVKLTKDALGVAKGMKDPLYKVLITIILHLINNQPIKYYYYLEEKALPILKKYGHVFLVKQYETELVNYYYKNGQIEKAMHIAYHLINQSETLHSSSYAKFFTKKGELI